MAPEQIEDRVLELVGLGVRRELVDAPDIAAGVDAVLAAARAAAAEVRVEHRRAEPLPALVGPEELLRCQAPDPVRHRVLAVRVRRGQQLPERVVREVDHGLRRARRRFAHAARPLHVNDRPGLRLHGDGARDSRGYPRHVPAEIGHDAAQDVRDGRVNGVVDHGWRLRRRSSEVERDVVVLLRHRDDGRVDLVLVLEVRPMAPRAVRKLAQPGSHALLAVVEQVQHERLHGLDAVLPAELLHARLRDVVRRDHRGEVEPNDLGDARHSQVQPHQVAAQLATLDDLHRREERLLAVDVLRADLDLPRDRTADVDLVDRRADPADELALEVDRAEDDDVHLMLRARVRVVAEEHVVGTDARVFRARGDDVLRERLHRDRVHEHVRRDHQGVAARRHDRGVHVVDLARDERTRDPFEGVRGLLVDAPEAMSKDLERDRIHPHRRSGFRFRRLRDRHRLPPARSVTIGPRAA